MLGAASLWINHIYLLQPCSDQCTCAARHAYVIYYVGFKLKARHIAIEIWEKHIFTCYLYFFLLDVNMHRIFQCISKLKLQLAKQCSVYTERYEYSEY